VSDRIITSAFGLGLIMLGLFMIKKNTKLFEFKTAFRERQPIVKVINPLGDLDSPRSSRFVSIIIGSFMLLAGVLLIVAAVFFAKT